MKIVWWALLSVAGLLVTERRISAINVDLTDADVHRAVGIALSAQGIRARFHEPYRVPVNDATVEHVEVITEFRRLVMASEDQALLGNWMFARGGFDSKGRTLRDTLHHWRGQVSIRTRIRFHPQHSYVALPAVDILIGEPSFLTLNVVSTPIVANAREGPGSPTGAVIEAFFNAPSFHDRVLPLRIVFEGKELVRPNVDFSRLE